MHFNDLLARLRFRGITALGAALAFVLTQVPPQHQPAFLACLALGWLLVGEVDTYYYSKLLGGAVAAAKQLEGRLGFVQLSTLIETQLQETKEEETEEAEKRGVLVTVRRLGRQVPGALAGAGLGAITAWLLALIDRFDSTGLIPYRYAVAGGAAVGFVVGLSGPCRYWLRKLFLRGGGKSAWSALYFHIASLLLLYTWFLLKPYFQCFLEVVAANPAP